MKHQYNTGTSFFHAEDTFDDTCLKKKEKRKKKKKKKKKNKKEKKNKEKSKKTTKTEKKVFYRLQVWFFVCVSC